MHFKTMDRDTILEILSKEEDILTSRSESDADFYKDIT